MPRFGFLSTYPPTRCGLATFTEALAGALVEVDRGPRIVRVVDAASPSTDLGFGTRAVVAELVNGDASSIAASIRTLNTFDVVVVQHEYGIFGGTDGDEIISVLQGLTAASIVVLHTVLDAPTPGQKAVLERVAALATSLVVMSDSAHEILALRYGVVMTKVATIPHGVPTPLADVACDQPSGRRVLTWGLIGPGKGLEWGIRAMAELADMDPRPEYLIVGRTHPKVLVNEGEAYRERLQSIVAELDLESVVTFVDEYPDGEELAAFVASADVVLLPYDTSNQVTSGVLVEAIAAGKPVVSTAFPHSIELLADGAGVVVDHENPHAIAEAVRAVLGENGRAAEMSAAASRIAVGTSWPDVALQYRRLAQSILAVRAA